MQDFHKVYQATAFPVITLITIIILIIFIMYLFIPSKACDYTKGGPCFKNNNKMRTKCGREDICGACVTSKGLTWTELNKNCSL